MTAPSSSIAPIRSHSPAPQNSFISRTTARMVASSLDACFVISSADWL
jgi:hypothetical protein